MPFILSSDIYDKRVIMLNGFEKETKDLTEYEEDVLLPLMIQGFENHVGADRAITNREICGKLRAKGYDVTEVRVRKIVNYIRTHNLVPRLMATGKGYYITNEPGELLGYISSLKGRREAISEVINVMQQQYMKMTGT
jgi:hypothetical protein